jgi:hypothetical protein
MWIVAVLAAALLQPSAVPCAADAVCASALAALGPDAPHVPIFVVTPKRLRLQGPQTEWIARTDLVTVEVANDTPQYKRAAKGHVAGLAAAIAHEAFHVTNGLAEPPAYAEQLRVLRTLGASRGEIADVEQSLYAVTPSSR